MTQNGVVTKTLEKGMVQVAVERGTACGGSCSGGCEACVYASRILVDAENRVYAAPGDKVILESSTAGIMGAALLLYLFPLVFFFGGYALAAAFTEGQGVRVLASLLGAVLGGLITVLLARRKKKLRFAVIGYQR